MEIRNAKVSRAPARAVLFDFDGTISTLRCGWETVMKPLMLEVISGGDQWDEALEREVDAYIDESTGIQTIRQMKWLAETACARGLNPRATSDPWYYKAEYNRRLMETVEKRIASLTSDEARDRYLMAGSVPFLKALAERGVKIYVASGTDHPDVVREAARLGVAGYFTQIAGSPLGSESCSKEKVIAQLMEAESLRGDDFAVIGDGKVEIRLGKEAGARTVGLASDEKNRRGVDAVKRARLIQAGADVICGDFLEKDELLDFLGLL